MIDGLIDWQIDAPKDTKQHDIQPASLTNELPANDVEVYLCSTCYQLGINMLHSSGPDECIALRSRFARHVDQYRVI